MTPFYVTGKLALVTGANRGIGYGAARALAEAGANLILVARGAVELERVAVELRSIPAKVHVAPFDLSHTAEIAGWFAKLCVAAGPPDMLVNAAGISRRGAALDLSLSDWNEVMDVNAAAIFELSRSFARARIAQGGGGKIVNVASLMTARARAGTSPYTASKGAVGQLTKALAVEWAAHGIQVNAIAPGYIQTDLTEDLVADSNFDAWVKERCPMGRWGTPQDIAWPVVFLTSPAADFITGQIIYVDGGWLAAV